MENILFTKEGYEKLKLEQADLTEKRKDAVIDLSKARAMGDLSENGYYKAAKFKLGDIDRRLRELRYQIRFGNVVEKSKSDTVRVGSTVTMQTESARVTYSIVGDFEANPLEFKISHTSPLGKILMGKKVGDTVLLHAPKGQLEYILLKVE